MKNQKTFSCLLVVGFFLILIIVFVSLQSFITKSEVVYAFPPINLNLTKSPRSPTAGHLTSPTNSTKSPPQLINHPPILTSGSNNSYTNYTDGISAIVPPGWGAEAGQNEANNTLLEAIRVIPPLSQDPEALV